MRFTAVAALSSVNIQNAKEWERGMEGVGGAKHAPDKMASINFNRTQL